MDEIRGTSLNDLVKMLEEIKSRLNLTQWQGTEPKTMTVLGQEYYQSMKRSQKLPVGLTAFLFIFVSITPAYSATSLLNKSCTKLKATKVSAGKNLICTSNFEDKHPDISATCTRRSPLIQTI